MDANRGFGGRNGILALMLAGGLLLSTTAQSQNQPTVSGPNGCPTDIAASDLPGLRLVNRLSGERVGKQIRRPGGKKRAASMITSFPPDPAPYRTATVYWSPPTTTVDGAPLSNLAGFRIAYGQSSCDLSSSVAIPSAAITSATIENLSPGTWYFAVIAYTTAEIESDLSTIRQKVIY